MNRKFLLSLRSLVALSVGLSLTALAPAGITLKDKNSTVDFDTGSNAGMFSWVIDGTDHFYKNTQQTGKQWFWYRIGKSGPELSIDTLTLTSQLATDTNGDGNPDLLFLRYFNAQDNFDIEISYLLRGSPTGSLSSDVAETINVHNLSAKSLDFHLFQYTDLDLSGTAGDDVAVRVNANTIRQTDPSVIFNETVVTPPADRWEIAPWSTTVDKLTDANADDLANAASPVGPTDVAWAFQWDRLLTPAGAPGSVLQISKDKNIRIVPTPAAVVLGLIGLGVVGWLRYRFV